MALRGWVGPACLVLLAGFAASGEPARAEAAGDAALCERAIAAGARAVGVPADVLHAVALTETGRRLDGRLQPWPWAVNREGEGFWFASREEALAFARRSLAEQRPSFDLGCFQINYRWHGRNFPSVEAMVEPETGAVYAARFLRDLHAELGSWSAAAGAYHSRTPELAARYRDRFDRILAGLGGAPMPSDDTVITAAAPAPDIRMPSPPVRQVRGPKIITIVPEGAEGVAAAEHAPSGPGVIQVTVRNGVPPLAAGPQL